MIIGEMTRETEMSKMPKTIAEQLDAAQSGEEFAKVLTSWLDSLAAARDDD
jgi:hypothetical protein